MLPGLTSAIIGGSNAPTVSYRASVNDAVSRSTYTFAATSIGTASASRYVVVAVATVDGTVAAHNSVTVGGVSCNSLANAGTSGDNRVTMWITQTAIESGTTADIVVTCSNSETACTIGVWAVYDITSNTAADAQTDTGTTLSVSVTVPAGGVIIAAAFATSAGPPTHTWTNVTEDFETANAGGRFSGASTVSVAGGTIAVSDVASSTNADDRMAVVVLR